MNTMSISRRKFAQLGSALLPQSLGHHYAFAEPN